MDYVRMYMPECVSVCMQMYPFTLGKADADECFMVKAFVTVFISTLIFEITFYYYYDYLYVRFFSYFKYNIREKNVIEPTQTKMRSQTDKAL